MLPSPVFPSHAVSQAGGGGGVEWGGVRIHLFLLEPGAQAPVRTLFFFFHKIVEAEISRK